MIVVIFTTPSAHSIVAVGALLLATKKEIARKSWPSSFSASIATEKLLIGSLSARSTKNG